MITILHIGMAICLVCQLSDIIGWTLSPSLMMNGFEIAALLMIGVVSVPLVMCPISGEFLNHGSEGLKHWWKVCWLLEELLQCFLVCLSNSGCCFLLLAVWNVDLIADQ